MMRLLLDTHVALWAVMAPERLNHSTQNWISNPDNEVAVSIIALWEIAIKRSVRRDGNETPKLTPKDAKTAFSDADFDMLGLAIDHFNIVEVLPFHHRDPFDRLLIATAMANQYKILTRDKMLAAYGDFVMLV